MSYRRSPIGLHLTTRFPGDDLNQPAGHGVYHWLAALQPACIVVNNNAEIAARLAREYPQMTVVYRIHERFDGAATDDDSHRHETAAQTVARMKAKATAYGIPLDANVWFAFNNEPTYTNEAAPYDDLQLVVNHAIGVYHLAAAAGMHVAGPHFGVTHPDTNDQRTMGILAPMFAAAIECGALVGLHLYSPGPTMPRTIPTPNGDWIINETWWSRIPAAIIDRYPGIRFVLSEIGDENIANVPGSGTYKQLGIDGATYAKRLTEWLWDMVLAPMADNIVGCCLYCFDEDGDPTTSRWNAWDIRGSDGVRDTLAAWVPVRGAGELPVPAGEPEPVPEPEPPAPVPVWHGWARALAAWLRRAADWLEKLATSYPNRFA